MALTNAILAKFLLDLIAIVYYDGYKYLEPSEKAEIDSDFASFTLEASFIIFFNLVQVVSRVEMGFDEIFTKIG